MSLEELSRVLNGLAQNDTFFFRDGREIRHMSSGYFEYVHYSLYTRTYINKDELLDYLSGSSCWHPNCISCGGECSLNEYRNNDGFCLCCAAPCIDDQLEIKTKLYELNKTPDCSWMEFK